MKELLARVRATLRLVRERKQAYQFTFSRIGSQDVLIDLARFCRANRSCFDPDPHKAALLEGRREVWLRIQEHLNLTAEELTEIYTGHQVRVVRATEDGNERDDD